MYIPFPVLFIPPCGSNFPSNNTFFPPEDLPLAVLAVQFEAMHSFSFCLSENIFISFYFKKYISLNIKFYFGHLFLPALQKYHFVVFRTSFFDEKSADILIIVPLCPFALAAFKIFFFVYSPSNSPSPPSRLPPNVEQSSLCYTVGSCWLCFLNIAVCICQSQTPQLFLILFHCAWRTCTV